MSFLSAVVAVAFVAFCLSVQAATGAWHADFVAHGDEPAHFVGAVMMRDYLVSGRLLKPFRFAQEYYAHYPFFAVGYWPPAFYSVTALWLLIAGVGRVQALIVPMIFAAGTAWLIFRLVRLRAGPGAGICAGFLYLTLPTVQQWMCAVMVDHFTAFFCLAAGVCLLRYMKTPDVPNGLLCAICSAFAVMSKYSAAYVIVLPFAAAWMARRQDLWRKPSFFLQPVLIGLLAAPWVLATRYLAFYGLPAEKKPLTLARIASFVLHAFEIFPPVLMAAVILGLISLILLPKIWGTDVIVMSLLGAGNLACLLLSPVGAEPRYLLVMAACMLVLSAAGWAGAWSSLGKGDRLPDVPFAVAGLAAALVSFPFGVRQHHPYESPVRAVVQSVQHNHAWAGKTILVPADLEGAFIAEFVALDPRRPGYYLVRPSKTMASMNWFGGEYHSRFSSPSEANDDFRKNKVDLIVSHERPAANLTAHELILSDALEDRAEWRRASSLDDETGSWSVYQRVSSISVAGGQSGAQPYQ